MARPKKEEGVPTARETIKESFWKLYRDRPFEKISVKEVCEGANINKTTFYYHFQDLRAVLDEIEEDSLPLEAPRMIAALVRPVAKEDIVSTFIGNMGERFERYCLLLSSKGDPDFAKRAKQIMTQRWCEELGIEYDKLPSDIKMAIRFLMGGTTSIFADHGDGKPFDPEVFADVIVSLMEPFAQRAAALSLI